MKIKRKINGIYMLQILKPTKPTKPTKLEKNSEISNFVKYIWNNSQFY